jgi:hypothetical protein
VLNKTVYKAMCHAHKYHFKIRNNFENNSVCLLFSQDSAPSSELSLPNFGDKFDQLKTAGHQKEPDIHVPLNDGNTEAVPSGFSLEPVVLSLVKEDAACRHSSSQTYNVKKQTSRGGKTNLLYFDFLMTSESDSKHDYQFFSPNFNLCCVGKGDLGLPGGL